MAQLAKYFPCMREIGVGPKSPQTLVAKSGNDSSTVNHSATLVSVTSPQSYLG